MRFTKIYNNNYFLQTEKNIAFRIKWVSVTQETPPPTISAVLIMNIWSTCAEGWKGKQVCLLDRTFQKHFGERLSSVFTMKTRHNGATLKKQKYVSRKAWRPIKAYTNYIYKLKKVCWWAKDYLKTYTFSCFYHPEFVALLIKAWSEVLFIFIQSTLLTV